MFNSNQKKTLITLILFAVLFSLGAIQNSFAFDSGSDGSDGALDFSWAAANTTIIFDPSDALTFDGTATGRTLDNDNDNVFHFTTINIPKSVIVVLKASKLNWKPVYWLATGDINIAYLARLSLDGDAGHPSGSQAEGHYPAEPGPGGFAGGLGASSLNPAQPGFGPGGGLPASVDSGRGGAASHSTVGNTFSGTAGELYGSPFLLPIVGGSGGSGYGNGLAAQAASNSGGGAGGGAIIMATNTRFILDGRITSRGGNGGTNGYTDGSGGAIRILAPEFTGGINGNTYFDVRGGNYGGAGRVRVEANINNFTGLFYPDNAAAIRISGLVNSPAFLPNDARIPGWPSVRVTSINSTALPDEPRASFVVPDSTINTLDPVPVVFTSNNIPITATLKMQIVSPDDGVLDITPTYSSGDLTTSTWTADVSFPTGFSRGYLQATWNN